jgi:hypothetical protein
LKLDREGERDLHVLIRAEIEPSADLVRRKRRRVHPVVSFHPQRVDSVELLHGSNLEPIPVLLPLSARSAVLQVRPKHDITYRRNRLRDLGNHISKSYLFPTRESLQDLHSFSSVVE